MDKSTSGIIDFGLMFTTNGVVGELHLAGGQLCDRLTVGSTKGGPEERGEHSTDSQTHRQIFQNLADMEVTLNLA